MLLQGGENVAKKQTDGNLALEQQRVIVIPAHDEIVARKLRVAAYARVSSSSEDQLNSYRVQNQYYSELISGNPDWEMVDSIDSHSRVESNTGRYLTDSK